MSKFNPPAIRYSSLNELNFENQDLDNVKIAGMILQQLNQGTLTRIKNALENSVLISSFGELLISVDKLNDLFRTGNSGAESMFVRKGIGNSVSPSIMLNIENSFYISVFDFEAILSHRIDSASMYGGKKYQYLCYVKRLLEYLKNHSVYVDVRNLYLSQVDEYRPQLKIERYNLLQNKCCEFSKFRIDNLHNFEFAHIQSVVTNPRQELTRNQVHDFEGMYEFCEINNFDLEWAEQYLELGNY